MGKSGGISGGGIEGRKVVHGTSPKVEPKPHAVSPGHVSRIGHPTAPGAKVGPLYEGRGYSTPVGPTSNMGVGPGANREIHRSGSQSKTPAPTPMGPGRSFDGKRNA